MADRTSPAPRDTDADVWRLVDRLAPHLRIAHHISGRIRLKLDAAALVDRGLPAGTAGKLDALLTGLRGIRRVELNLLARSCVVEYDVAVIPDAAWPDLLGKRDTPAAAALIAVLREESGGA